MKTFAILAATMLSACASYNSNYAMNSMASSEPAAGQVLTANVGDTVIRQGRFTTAKAIRVEAPVKVGILGENQILAGYYVKEGEDAKSEFFRPENSPNGGKITKSALADPVKGLQAYKNRPTLCTVSILNFHDCRDNVAFTRVERLVLDSNSVQQHLVYGGRKGDIVTFGYVESANLMPRPAADGAVRHDVSTSSRVSFKGMTFDIVDATADSITYRVVASENTAA